MADSQKAVTKNMELMLIYVCLYYRKVNKLSPELPIPAMLPFNRLVRGLLPRYSRLPTMCSNDESNHGTLRRRQPQSNNETGTHINISLLPKGSTVSIPCKDGGTWMHRMIIKQDHNE